MSQERSLRVLPPRTDKEYIEAGLPPMRCAVTFPHERTGRYSQTHITDDRNTTLCVLLVPDVVWEPGGQTRDGYLLPYVNSSPVSCGICLFAAGISNKIPT